MISPGKCFVIFPISNVMIVEDNNSNSNSVWAYVGVKFYSKEEHRRYGPGRYLVSDFLFDYMDIDSHVSITWRLSYSYMYLSSHVLWLADDMVRASLSD